MQEAIQSHDNRFRQLLTRCRAKGIKLNKEKVAFKTQEVQFIGHILSSQGLKPDPKKIEAITKMPKPTDVQGVQRLIGMINYLSKFVKGLSDLCEPLRKLTKKESAWDWTFEHDTAFENMKKAISSTPLLRYFNSKEDVVLQCDASDTGLGAALMQNEQPVAYASRALSPTERNYAQIEKELLAILFGVTRFNQYTYGRKFLVESDHKPLEAIQNKPLIAAPKRLQRMLLGLQRYNYEIVYKKGSQMYLADTLSRAFLQSEECSSNTPEVLITDVAGDDLTSEEIEQIHMADYLPIPEPRLQEIREATKADDSLRTLQEAILRGWPESRHKVPSLAQPYFTVRDELSLQDGIIFRGARCIIPSSLRADMLTRIHSSHGGIEACRRRGRECMYWPGMSSQITDFVQGCDTCRTLDPKQQKEPLINHDIPDRPWAKIGTDIMTIKEADYLVTVDYFSDFIEIDRLDEKTGKEIIKKLKIHMARYGIPDTLVSDNGPPFGSRDFQSFSRKYEFDHVTSSPGYPQSNGKAESAVKIAKTLIKKAQKSGEDPYIALLDYRNTPTAGMNSSPVQRLMSRRTKTLLPTSKPLLKPEIIEDVLVKKEAKKKTQSKYYNRKTKKLSELHSGDPVKVQSLKKYDPEWQDGTVERRVDIRSYDVRLEDGNVMRRNRIHLRPRHHNKHSTVPESTLLQPTSREQPTSRPMSLHPATAAGPTSTPAVLQSSTPDQPPQQQQSATQTVVKTGTGTTKHGTTKHGTTKHGTTKTGTTKSGTTQTGTTQNGTTNFGTTNNGTTQNGTTNIGTTNIGTTNIGTTPVVPVRDSTATRTRSGRSVRLPAHLRDFVH